MPKREVSTFYGKGFETESDGARTVERSMRKLGVRELFMGELSQAE